MVFPLPFFGSFEFNYKKKKCSSDAINAVLRDIDDSIDPTSAGL
jgi:hypothetical protein